MNDASRRIGPSGAILEAAGLRKSFGTSEILRGVDLSVRPGERIVIMGPSGSGKSTLVRCLNGLEPINQGTIRFQGRDITAVPEAGWREIRRSIGMVFQNYALFPHMTVLANMTFAPVRAGLLRRTEARARAIVLLARVGLHDKAAAYPAALSGGQQQRVAIVRAMMMAPSVMLFDEPTSALDPETVGDVLGIIAELTAEGLTSIIVTHEAGFARRCADRIVFMDAGRVVETATPDVFFDKPASDRARRFVGRIAAGLQQPTRRAP